MASSKTWLDLLAWTKALFEATKATVDVVALYKKYSSDPETPERSATCQHPVLYILRGRGDSAVDANVQVPNTIRGRR